MPLRARVESQIFCGPRITSPRLNKLNQPFTEDPGDIP
jgi:hypothetical protein